MKHEYGIEDYTYRTFWSNEDECYFGAVAEFALLSAFADTPQKALEEIMNVVRSSRKDAEAQGQEFPPPFCARSYSGNFALRMTPEQHRRIAMEAAEQHVSINHLICSRI